MPRKIYNKLIRDGIHAVMDRKGLKYKTRIMDETEYRKAARQKVVEECMEIVNAANREKLIEELADLAEIVRAVCDAEKISATEIEDIRAQKETKRGAFKKRLFLEYVDEPDGYSR